MDSASLSLRVHIHTQSQPWIQPLFLSGFSLSFSQDSHTYINTEYIHFITKQKTHKYRIQANFHSWCVVSLCSWLLHADETSSLVQRFPLNSALTKNGYMEYGNPMATYWIKWAIPSRPREAADDGEGCQIPGCRVPTMGMSEAQDVG